MKRITAWLLIGVVAFLTACGGNGGEKPAASASTGVVSEESGKPKETVTIRTNLGEAELTKDQIVEFETAHPGIKIELESTDKTKLAAQLATNSAPDVIRINGAFDTPSYAIRGIAMDLTERIENSSLIDMGDLLPIAGVYRFDGKTIGQGPIYGLPKDWSNDYAVFYNKRAFAAAGIEIPDASQPLTWPEVMDLAKKLTIVENGKVVQYGLAANEWGKTEPNFNFLLQYVLSAGGTINAEDQRSVDFNIQPVKDFMTMWIDGVKSGIGPNALNNDQMSGGELFLSDKAAMLINGYWYGGVIRSNADAMTHLEDFGMLPTPVAPGGKRVAPPGGATGAIINRNTEHPEETWMFYEWFFAGKPADDRAKTGWGMPVFKSKMSLLPQETEFDKRLHAVLEEESKYTDQFLPVNPYLSDSGWGIYEKYMQPLYFGKSSIDEAISGLTKDANVIITEAINAIGNN